MTTTTFGVPFDLSRTKPVASSTGYTRDERKKLQDEALVKFRDTFVRKILKSSLSINLTVTSYKPSEMDSKTNFFNSIASWSDASRAFESWLKTYHVHTVFNILNVEKDATGTDTLVETGSLFKVWNQLPLDKVFESCVTYRRFANEAVELQNLNLSWEFILANVDEDMRATINAEITPFVEKDEQAAQTGPMAYWIVANRIVVMSDALAHNIVTGIMTMGLVHFKGESVPECIAVLRNVLLFLGHGTANSKCPPTIMDTLTDVFLRCSVVVFVNYIRNCKDFNNSSIDTPEKLFKVAREYYNTLILKPNGWVKVSKTKSAFVAGEPLVSGELPELSALLEADAKVSETKVNPPQDTKQPEYDRRGRLIDRNPPKDAVCERKNANGFTEYWCPICNRWGNHIELNHAKWKEDMKKRRSEWQAQSQKKKEEETNAATETAPSMQRATIALCKPIVSVAKFFSSPYDSDQSF